MAGLLQDLRYAGRMLFKHPGVTAIAVVALAMGIGLTAVMYSIVHGALYRGLPFEGGDRIIHLERSNLAEGITDMSVSIHDYTDWREQQTSFEELGAYYEGTANLRGSERTDRYDGVFITANALATLGVQPILGRLFTEDEDGPGGASVVILGHQVWTDRFGQDPDILGETVYLNRKATTVVGVMPENFKFPTQNDLWAPLRLDPVELERNAGAGLDVFGRLGHGVTVDEALVEFNGIAARLEAQYPEANEGVRVIMQPFTREYIGREAAPVLYSMLIAVFLVLVVAGANVANLLLARAALRSKEVAIRTAMGASRFRVLLQLLIESFALSLVGALAGVAIAWVGIDWFDKVVAGTQPPYWLVFRLDGPVLLFIVALTMISALVSGVLPALKASGSSPQDVLKDDSRGSSSLRIGRLSRSLVVVEMALSAGVLVVAGLMIKGVTKLNNLDLPFATEDVLRVRVGLTEDYADLETQVRFFDELERRLVDKPGVASVALALGLPGLRSSTTSYARDGESYATDQDYPRAHWSMVTPAFFETFGVNVLRGRGITDLDADGAPPVVLINESMARRDFPGEDALGKRVRRGRSESTEEWATIVGVVPDLNMAGIGDDDDDDEEGMYFPVAQLGSRFLTVALRARGNPLDLAPLVRDEVAAMDKEVPVYWVETLPSAISQNTWFYRTFGTLFLIFGLVALFLSSVGLYGVMSFGVSSRTREVGIRMALGAQGKQVRNLILRQSFAQIAIGLVVGLGIAAALSRGMAIVLFETEPWDPAIFALISVVLAGSGLLAALIPALRATRIDPMEALRYE
ncbi:MAG: ABC transporter permease [Longimicrobiales bacterium]